MSRQLVIALFCLQIAACTPSREPVRIGILVWPPYELVVLARNQGLYPIDEFKLVNYQTPAELVRAYRYGLIDAMFTTSQFALDQHQLSRATRLVYVIDASLGGDTLVARESLRELDDIRDRRIGVEASLLGGYMLQRVLDHAGLTRSEIEMVFVDTPDQARAFTEGRVDAVITYEPTRTHLLDSGANELFSSRQIPNEILDVLLVSAGTLDSREAALQDFVKGVSEACRRLSEFGPSELAPLARRQDLSVVAFMQALSGMKLMDMADNRALLTGSPPPLATALDRQIEVLQRANLVIEPVDPARMIDARLINGARQ